MANTLVGQGASAGAALGTLVAPGVGTAIGAGIGAGLGAIPALVKTEAELENERRLRELRRQQEMGTLGLTEAEKQAIYTAQQSALQGQLQQAQTQIRAAGAAGMGTGAGTEVLRQTQLAEAEARAMADAARGVEQKQLERKRELEDEIQQRIAAQSLAKQERLETAMSIPLEAAGGLAQQQIGSMLDIRSTLPQQGATGPDYLSWSKSVGLKGNYTPEQLQEIAGILQSGSEYNYLIK